MRNNVQKIYGKAIDEQLYCKFCFDEQLPLEDKGFFIRIFQLV